VDKSPTYAALRRLVSEGRILHWGVSVETVDEAMLAIAQPDCATVQIIFNILRTKPSRAFLPAALAADVGTIIRLPLASGLLTGKVDAAYLAALEDGDHRRFNVSGAAFDKGETWSGARGAPARRGAACSGAAQGHRSGRAGAGRAPAWHDAGAVLAALDPGQARAPRASSPGPRTLAQVQGNLQAGALPALSGTRARAGRGGVRDAREGRH